MGDRIRRAVGAIEFLEGVQGKLPAEDLRLETKRVTSRSRETHIDLRCGREHILQSTKHWEVSGGCPEGAGR
ncbi:UNVERIFIED_CONTAM: hypothetical protein ABIE34_000334 [Jeotgalibacillus campisalis]